MTPSVSSSFSSSFTTSVQSSQNYKMHFADCIIRGFVDELQAMEQVIYKILNTERYQYAIYSWNYGVELLDLFGKPTSYVCPEIERRITEALLQDNRITSVSNFNFEIIDKKNIAVTFKVNTIFGDINAEKVVTY